MIVQMKNADNQEQGNGPQTRFRNRWHIDRDNDRRRFDDYIRPVLCLLAVAKEPISVQQLAIWTDIKPKRVGEVLKDWKDFVQTKASEEGELLYYVGRPFVQAFIKQENGLKDYHSTIVDKGIKELIESLPSNLPLYYRRHFVAHMIEAGRADDLHHLLWFKVHDRPLGFWRQAMYVIFQIMSRKPDRIRNVWYDLKCSNGEVAEYLKDIAKAWALAESVSDDQPEDKPYSGLGLEVRYALVSVFAKTVTMQAKRSYGNRIDDYPSNALLTKVPFELVKFGYMNEAIEAILQIPNELSRLEVLKRFIQDLPITLDVVFQFVREFKDPEKRFRAITRLALRLPAEEQQVVVSEAIGILLEAGRKRKRDDLWRFVRMIRNVPNELREKLPQEMVGLLRRIPQQLNSSDVLAGIMPYLPHTVRKELLTEALRALRTIRRKGIGVGQVETITQFLPYVPDGLCNEVVDAYFQGLMDSYCAIFGDSAWAKRLYVESVKLARQGWVDCALDLIREIQFEGFRTKALVEIASHGAQQAFQKLYEEAQRLWGPFRAAALAALLPYVEDESRDVLIKGALETVGESRCQDAYRAAMMGPPLSAGSVGNIQDYHPELEYLFEGFHVKDHKLLWKLCFSPDAIDREVEKQRVKAWSKMAPYLSEEDIQKAFDWVTAIGSEDAKVEGVKGLVPFLSERLLRRALEVATEIKRTSASWFEHKETLMGEIIRRFAKLGHVHEALDVALRENDNDVILRALGDLISQLDNAIFDDAWRAMYRIIAETKEDQAPYRRGALSIHRKKVMVKLVEHFVKTHGIQEAFDTVMAFANGEDRAVGIGIVLSSISLHRRAEQYSLVRQVLRRLADGTRQNALFTIENLLPVLINLGGEKVVEKMLAELHEINQWCYL